MANVIQRLRMYTKAGNIQKTIDTLALIRLEQLAIENQDKILGILIKDAGDGNVEYSTIMQRSNGVQTVSITQVVSDRKTFKMFHKNFPEKTEGSEELQINA